MVVPEKSHLLPQRRIRFQHPPEPPALRLDAVLAIRPLLLLVELAASLLRLFRRQATGRTAHLLHLLQPLLHVGRRLVAVCPRWQGESVHGLGRREQALDSPVSAERVEALNLLRGSPETRATQQMRGFLEGPLVRCGG